MRIAAVFVSIALMLGPLASSADSASSLQWPRPRFAPPVPPPRRPTVTVVPAPVCDVALQTPTYPPSSIANGEVGTVELMMFIDLSGKIVEAIIHKSSGASSLDAAVIESTKSWLMEPGTSDGRPTRMWGSVVVTFHLEKGPPQAAKVEVTFPGAPSQERCVL